MQSTLFEKHIDNFATIIWQHALLRASGAPPDTQAMHARIVKQTLSIDIDPVDDSKVIGESLCGKVLEHAVQLTRSKYPSQQYLEKQKALMIKAVFMLDRVYGLNARELISVVARFIEEMERNKTTP